jgi:Protein of unknown function (DUF3631)
LNDDHPQGEISSADLCKALVGIETALWSELNRGKPMTPARLSRMLKDFEVYVARDLPSQTAPQPKA